MTKEVIEDETNFKVLNNKNNLNTDKKEIYN
jgi:hypothetical protein